MNKFSLIIDSSEVKYLEMNTFQDSKKHMHSIKLKSSDREFNKKFFYSMPQILSLSKKEGLTEYLFIPREHLKLIGIDIAQIYHLRNTRNIWLVFDAKPYFNFHIFRSNSWGLKAEISHAKKDRYLCERKEFSGLLILLDQNTVTEGEDANEIRLFDLF
jgi:hypothetical protein